MDCDDLRKTLKDIVEDYIKKNRQPIKTSITLNDQIIAGGTISSYINHTTFNSLEKNIYVIEYKGRYIEISDEASKMLIKYAILPLQLKWEFIGVNSISGYIKISWNHWSVN